jgi:anaerobic selenocysteine-containing dehydrogenase
LAHRLGFGKTHFPWKDEEAVNRWLLEPSGISLKDLIVHPEGCLYTPVVEYKKFETKPFPTPSGKFEFSSERLKRMGYDLLPIYSPPDYLTAPSPDYPLRMISGTRRSVYYHSRFREIERFKKAIPSARAAIHIDDAVSLGISDGDMVRIVSNISELIIEVRVIEDGSLLQGFIEVPHGWNNANVNRLTDDCDADPVSGFPNMKIVPVRVVSL